MKRHSAALMQHYYGTLPNYFPLWLKSAGANPGFTFMIFTDIDFSGYNVPDNVHVIHMTFDGLKERIAKHLDFKFACSTPYKACDYRPMYGLMFEDFLTDYEFWGYVDPDIILGDMNRFITPEMLDRFDRIYRAGHLQFFRNTEKTRTFVLNKLPYWNISYRDIYSTEEHMFFEERALVSHLFRNFGDSGGGSYYALDYADINPCYKEFKRFGYNEAIPAFRWINGKLYGTSPG